MQTIDTNHEDMIVSIMNIQSVYMDVYGSYSIVQVVNLIMLWYYSTSKRKSEEVSRMFCHLLIALCCVRRLV